MSEEQRTFSEKNLKPFYLCNKCGARIQTPKMLLNMNFQGNVNLNCGRHYNATNKNPQGVKCTGKAVIIGNPERHKFIQKYRDASGMNKKQWEDFISKNEPFKNANGEWAMISKPPIEQQTKIEENVSSKS